MSKKRNTFCAMQLAASLLSLLTTLSTPPAAQAQYVAANAKDTGSSISSQVPSTASQKGKLSEGAPLRPQGDDAKVIQGINNAGTVMVMNLANFEALLNIGANGTETIGILWGAFLLAAAFSKTQKAKRIRTRTALLSLLVISVSLATPSTFNWLIAMARDANLFS